MAEPRKNCGRRRVPRNSKNSIDTTLEERIDLILRFEGNVQGPQVRSRLVDRIMLEYKKMVVDLTNLIEGRGNEAE